MKIITQLRIGIAMPLIFVLFGMGGFFPPAAQGENTGISAAQSENGFNPESTGTGNSRPAVKAEPAGNEICPVSGEKIDPNDGITYEYKGKVYNFCCPDCVEQFKKGPEQYIRKLNKERAGSGSPERPAHEDHNA